MPATAATQVFTSIRTVGGLLPADMLRNIMSGRDVSASAPADYHVVGVRSVKDAAERHWDYLRGAWRALRSKIGSSGDPLGLATENWMLPLFEEYGYGRLARVPGSGLPSDDGSTVFPVTHQWQHVPIHLVSWSQDLDKRQPGGGLPPQSMVQECLNRTEASPVGDRVEWPGAANPARLVFPCWVVVPGDRPGGNVRRRAVRRVRTALPAAPRLPLRGRRRGRSVGLPHGEVAHRGNRGRHPVPRRHH